MLRTLAIASVAGVVAGLKIKRNAPPIKGPGIPENSEAIACAECAKYKDYLDGKDDCSCHVSDIMRTFENDATYELKTRSEYGFQSDQTGKAQLAQGWTWHCRPISDTPD